MEQTLQTVGKLKAQYIKDLSFEMKDPAQTLKEGSAQEQDKPEVKLDVNVNARKIGEGTGENSGKSLFEVTISTSAKGSVKKEDFFVIELLYAGIFELDEVAADLQEKFCLADAPTLLFPFVSRIVSDITRDGGVMPIRLEPINFHHLYLKSKEKNTGEVN